MFGNLCMINFLYFLFILISSASSESLLDKIGWHGPETSVIIGLSVFIIVVLFFFIVYYFRQTLTQKNISKKHSDNLFMETAVQLDLTKTEITKIKQLLKDQNMTEPQIIFQSVSLYEKCIDKEIKMLLAKNIPDTTRTEENQILSNIRRKIGFSHLALEHPLSSTRNTSIGQRGAIYGRNHKKPLIQHANIVESNEFTFVLQYNVDKEDVCYISSGDEIKFAFSRQNDSVYGVALKVLSADGSGTIEVFHTLDLRRSQLRQYVRIELSLPIKFRLLTTSDPDKSEIRRGEVVSARMSDISGGGLSLLCERSLRVGDLTSLGFQLPTANFSRISGKILRISLQEGRLKTFYKHHVKFVNMETRMRDKIVKYVFNKQRQINQWH